MNVFRFNYEGEREPKTTIKDIIYESRRSVRERENKLESTVLTKIMLRSGNRQPTEAEVVDLEA